MRSVLKNHREVAHIWASRSQLQGRSGNMFFDGDSIFSYGSHFEIARHVDGVVLFTSRDYSVSTAKHKGYVINSVSHKEVFTVPSFEDHNENGSYYHEAIRELQIKARRAKQAQAFRIEELGGLIKEAARYAALFRPENESILFQWADKKRRGELFSETELEKMRVIESIAREKTRKAKEEREARWAVEREKAFKTLESWKAGESVHLPYGFDFPLMLRIKDGRIETSRGAQITVRTALRLWDKLKAGEDVSGFVIDNYTVTSYDGETLTVGCHKIPMAEIERIAGILNSMMTAAQ